jgi:hypothetical protein
MLQKGAPIDPLGQVIVEQRILDFAEFASGPVDRFAGPGQIALPGGGAADRYPVRVIYRTALRQRRK